MRLFPEEVYSEDAGCVVCLEKECEPAMKMCPPCKSAFHYHCIAGWLLKFDHSSCPHCRARLTHRMLEDVELVSPFKVLRTSSMQTMSETFPAMRSEGCQTSEPFLQAHRLSMTPLNQFRSPRPADNPVSSSPLSPFWSPVTVSPIINVSLTGSSVGTSSAGSSPAVNPSPPSHPPPLTPPPPPPPRVISELPLFQTPRTNHLTSAAPLAFTTGGGETSDDSIMDIWNFIVDQLRQQGWQTTYLPSFHNGTHLGES